MIVEAHFRNGDEEVWSDVWYTEVDRSAAAEGLMTLCFEADEDGIPDDVTVDLTEVLEIRTLLED